MRERAQELKGAARRSRRGNASDESAVLAKIAEMPAPDRETRYATLGFSDKAALDEGHMWPTSFALTELAAADEARIAALVKKAVSSTPSLAPPG